LGTEDPGDRCAQPIPAMGELGRLDRYQGRFVHRLWLRRACAFPGRSSEAFTGICNTAQHQLGCEFIHLLNVSDQAILLRGGPSRLCQRGRSAHRVWWKRLYLLFGLSSEAFINIRNPTQDVPGHAFIHLLGASEHFFCTTVPMHRIVVSHDQGKQRIFCQTWCADMCGYVSFHPQQAFCASFRGIG
jgi:hypothetical protein